MRFYKAIKRIDTKKLETIIGLWLAGPWKMGRDRRGRKGGAFQAGGTARARHGAGGRLRVRVHMRTCECAGWYREDDKESGLTGENSLLDGRREISSEKP